MSSIEIPCSRCNVISRWSYQPNDHNFVVRQLRYLVTTEQPAYRSDTGLAKIWYCELQPSHKLFELENIISPSRNTVYAFLGCGLERAAVDSTCTSTAFFGSYRLEYQSTGRTSEQLLNGGRTWGSVALWLEKLVLPAHFLTMTKTIICVSSKKEKHANTGRLIIVRFASTNEVTLYSWWIYSIIIYSIFGLKLTSG